MVLERGVEYQLHLYLQLAMIDKKSIEFHIRHWGFNKNLHITQPKMYAPFMLRTTNTLENNYL